MNANELSFKDLMVGDWVYGIFSGYPQEKITMKYSICSNSYEWKYMPIPLTPEILEKNGFKLDKEDGWWWLTPKIGITFWEESDIELEFENTHSSVDTHIKYVHELQHAFRLCGIEKEIEL